MTGQATPVSTCGCDQPDSCIHEIVVKNAKKAGQPLATYRQDKPLADFYVHDSDGKGVGLDIELTDKGCAGSHPGCPAGALWRTTDFFEKINKGSNSVTLKYVPSVWSPAWEVSADYSILDLVNDIVLADTDSLPSTDYRLLITECDNLPMVQKAIFSQVTEMGSRVATDSLIRVLPKLSWKLSIVFEVATFRRKTQHSTDQRRAAQRAANRERGHDNRSGWTRHSPGETLDSGFSFKNENELEIGNTKKTGNLTLLNKEYSELRHNSRVFQNIENTLEVAAQLQALARVSGNILDFEVKYPKVSLSGSGELKYEKGKPFYDNKVEVSCDPLIGFKVTISFLEALKKAYPPVNAALSAARAQKVRVLDGKNGMYVDAWVNLIFKAELDSKFKLASSRGQGLEFTPEGSVEAQLVIELEAGIEAGFSYWVVEGIFKAGARLVTEGMATLEQNPDTKAVELILHHKGIIAEVYIATKFTAKTGEGEKVVEGDNSSGGVRSSALTTVESKAPQLEYGEKEKLGDWTLYEKLDKKDSTCRFTLF